MESPSLGFGFVIFHGRQNAAHAQYGYVIHVIRTRDEASILLLAVDSGLFSFQGMDSTSLNTLKSLTNSHTIRGIATLKVVERFRKGHLERYRESIVKLPMKMPIVKLIVNYLSNKLPIYSKDTYIQLIQTLEAQRTQLQNVNKGLPSKKRGLQAFQAKKIQD